MLIGLIETHQLYKFDTKKGEQVAAQKETKKDKSRKDPHVSKSSAGNSSHEIHRMGIKKYIILKADDSIEKIAKETDKDEWQLYKYNDIEKGQKLIAGQKLFLQPKRNKAKEPFHIAKEGETMQYISQLYGVKLKMLYRKNNMEEGKEPKAGEKIYLRKNKPLNPEDDSDF